MLMEFVSTCRLTRETTDLLKTPEGVPYEFHSDLFFKVTIYEDVYNIKMLQSLLPVYLHRNDNNTKVHFCNLSNALKKSPYGKNSDLQQLILLLGLYFSGKSHLQPNVCFSMGRSIMSSCDFSQHQLSHFRPQQRCEHFIVRLPSPP